MGILASLRAWRNRPDRLDYLDARTEAAIRDMDEQRARVRALEDARAALSEEVGQQAFLHGQRLQTAESRIAQLEGETRALRDLVAGLRRDLTEMSEDDGR